MNKDMIQGKWTEFKGEAKRAWGKLTDNDLDTAKGNIESIQGKLQAVYGYSKEKAKEEFDCLVKKFTSVVADKTDDLRDMVSMKAKKADHSMAKHAVALIALGTAMSLGGYMTPKAYANKTTEQKMDEVKQDVRTGAYKLTNKDTLVLTFDKGSSKLSNENKSKIRSLMEANSVNKNDKNKVILAAWADKDFISKDKTAKNATSNDKSLADKRISAIKDFLKSEKIAFSTDHEYNMAKEPSMFGKMIESRDTVVKEGVVNDSETGSDALNQDIERMQDKGGSQKAIVTLIR